MSSILSDERFKHRFMQRNHKWDANWQTKGKIINGVEMFNGVEINKLQNDGGYAKNWYPWIYFDGMIMGADKFGNLNLGYVGYEMGFRGIMLDNIYTSGGGDKFWVKYGITMAKKGR